MLPPELAKEMAGGEEADGDAAGAAWGAGDVQVCVGVGWGGTRFSQVAAHVEHSALLPTSSVNMACHSKSGLPLQSLVADTMPCGWGQVKEDAGADAMEEDAAAQRDQPHDDARDAAPIMPGEVWRPIWPTEANGQSCL